MVQMIAVLALPPKEDCNMRVSFESLKGKCPFLPLLQPNFLFLDEKKEILNLPFPKQNYINYSQYAKYIKLWSKFLKKKTLSLKPFFCL